MVCGKARPPKQVAVRIVVVGIRDCAARVRQEAYVALSVVAVVVRPGRIPLADALRVVSDRLSYSKRNLNAMRLWLWKPYHICVLNIQSFENDHVNTWEALSSQLCFCWNCGSV
jgi:hypothetical protein